MESVFPARIVVRDGDAYVLTAHTVCADPETCRFVGLRYIRGAGNAPLHALPDGRYAYIEDRQSFSAREVDPDLGTKAPTRMFYGVFRTKKGHPAPFFCTVDDLLPRAIVAFEEGYLTRKKAQEQATRLCDAYTKNPGAIVTEAIACAYGLLSSGIGNVRGFVSVADCIPKRVLLVERATIPMPAASARAEALLQSYQADPRPFRSRIAAQRASEVIEPVPVPSGEGIVDGAVVVCADRQGTHIAIVLEARADRCPVLMLTSRPGWNAHARQATAEELVLCGRPIRKTTYLAPTDFPTAQMSRMDGVFPPHRLESLRAEFGHCFDQAGVRRRAAGGSTR